MNDDYEDEETLDLFDDWDDEDFEAEEEGHEIEEEIYIKEQKAGEKDREALLSKLEKQIFDIKELDI